MIKTGSRHWIASLVDSLPSVIVISLSLHDIIHLYDLTL